VSHGALKNLQFTEEKAQARRPGGDAGSQRRGAPALRVEGGGRLVRRFVEMRCGCGFSEKISCESHGEGYGYGDVHEFANAAASALGSYGESGFDPRAR
jgi:hypothetical protein